MKEVVKGLKISVMIISATLLLLFALTMIGCQKVVCNKPYILVGTSCCLDQNDNNICDKDEISVNVTEPVKIVAVASEAENESRKVLDEYLSYFSNNGWKEYANNVQKQSELADEELKTYLEKVTLDANFESNIFESFLLNCSLLANKTVCESAYSDFKNDLGGAIDTINIVYKKVLNQTNDAITWEVSRNQIIDGSEVNSTVKYILKKKENSWKVVDAIQEDGSSLKNINVLKSYLDFSDKRMKYVNAQVKLFLNNARTISRNTHTSSGTVQETVETTPEVTEQHTEIPLAIEITGSERDKTIVQRVFFTIRNDGEKVINSLTCDYQLYNGQGKVTKRGNFKVGSESEFSDVGILAAGATKTYKIAPYQEMYDAGPYALNIICEGEVYHFDLKFTESCKDGIKNQGETDVDCGGPCNACVYEIGDSVVVDGIQFKIVGVRLREEIGEEAYGHFYGEKAEGQFYVIQLTIKNLDRLTRNVYPQEFVVFDDEENAYSHSWDAEWELKESESGSVFDYTENIQPTMEIRGNLVYDLPYHVLNPKLIVQSSEDGIAAIRLTK